MTCVKVCHSKLEVLSKSMVTGSPICIHAESGIAKTEREGEVLAVAAAVKKNKQSNQTNSPDWYCSTKRPFQIKAGRGTIWEQLDLISNHLM